MSGSRKTFKILSIDGGGIKGLYSAKILSHLEDEYKCRLSDHFDMICGTSTGGIIALALSLKVPAADILGFYKQKGPLIFPIQRKWPRKFAFVKQLLFRSKYRKSVLQDALQSVLGNAKMGDSENLLCIPSFNVTTGKNRVFKKNHHNLRGDDNLLMVDVALATSAAPTYFPMHMVDGAYFVDGGIWANNPTLCGLTEALKYFVSGEYDEIQILNVSSLNHSNGFQLKRKWYSLPTFERRSFADWGDKLFQFTLDAQAESLSFTLPIILGQLCCPAKQVMIPSHEISPDNVKCVGLDLAGNDSLQVLEVYGDQQGLRHRTTADISGFFDNKKIYQK